MREWSWSLSEGPPPSDRTTHGDYQADERADPLRRRGDRRKPCPRPVCGVDEVDPHLVVVPSCRVVERDRHQFAALSPFATGCCPAAAATSLTAARYWTRLDTSGASWDAI